MADTIATVAIAGFVFLCILGAMLPFAAIRVGITRMPPVAQQLWAEFPPSWQKWLTAIANSPFTWLAFGLVLGSAFLNPIARWLSALTH